jgi:hypothetical protein
MVESAEPLSVKLMLIVVAMAGAVPARQNRANSDRFIVDGLEQSEP